MRDFPSNGTEGSTEAIVLKKFSWWITLISLTVALEKYLFVGDFGEHTFNGYSPTYAL